jgi:hypothetical protein
MSTPRVLYWRVALVRAVCCASATLKARIPIWAWPGASRTPWPAAPLPPARVGRSGPRTPSSVATAVERQRVKRATSRRLDEPRTSHWSTARRRHNARRPAEHGLKATRARARHAESKGSQPQQFKTLHVVSRTIRQWTAWPRVIRRVSGRARLHVRGLTIVPSRLAGLGDGEVRAVRLVVRAPLDRGL